MALAALHSHYWQGAGDGEPGPSAPGYPGWQSTILTTGSNAVLVMPLQIAMSPREILPIEILLIIVSAVAVGAIILAVIALREVRVARRAMQALRALEFDTPASLDIGSVPADEARIIRRYTVFQQGVDGARAAIYSGTDRKLAKRLFTDMAVVPGGEVTCEADGQALWRRMA